LDNKTINTFVSWILGKIVALRKYIWSAISSREIDKMPRKWRSVRPRKMVNIELF
jgi:hypothetical protein